VAVSGLVPNWLEVVKEEVGKDSTLQVLIEKVKDGEALSPWNYKDGILFYKDQIYLLENSALLVTILEKYTAVSMRGTTKPSKESEPISIGRE
jgi:hypothetical protein